MAVTQRPNRKIRKEIMHDEATERQAKRDGRTPEQQLALLDKRGGQSLRERKRLEPLVEPPAEKPRRRRARRDPKKITAQQIREAARDATTAKLSD